MRKFLGSLVIVGLIVAAIGLWRGWFSLSREDLPGETKVELRIDREKVKADVDEAARRTGVRDGSEEQGSGEESSLDANSSATDEAPEGP